MSKSTAEIRQAFLDFFHKNGHQVVASSSLIPNNDSTLLFTNAGMNQFKDVFLGLDSRDYSRATTSQRCVRAGGKHNDLENVGYTERHHTFFEMLGNFSFSDYSKRDAIQYAWELLTSKNWFNLPKGRLWVTVCEADNETYEIWEKKVGIPREHIVRISNNESAPYASDNFWQMGDTGPCGPCTEIFYDHGDRILGGPLDRVQKNNDRYTEIWNIVFIQFNRQADGKIEPLPKLSVDTGMGLERISAILQHVYSNYEIDLFRTLIEAVKKVTSATNHANSKSLRVIADHIRSCAFLIVDGVSPSNENRGYVLRRIIRRAVRHGNMLGVKGTFFYKLVGPLISSMESVSDELKYHQLQVEQVLKTEEEKFAYTLERGLGLLDRELAKLTGDVLDGETVFRLYDTYGFPVDLTREICRERNIKIDRTGLEIAMKEQRYRAREFSSFNTTNPNAIICVDSITKFEGYNHLELSSTVIALFINGKAVDNISVGQKDAVVILNKTPFYAKSGGQIGDAGNIKGNGFHFKVYKTHKYGQVIGHIGELSFGLLKVGAIVEAQVDKERRIRISQNHTATHLVHAALRKILGTHVAQKGSLVNDKILRFDFSHFNAMKISEIRAVENLVNAQIRRNMLVETVTMDINEAKRKGVVALFSDKYSEYVRMLRLGDFSVELCGGTHVSRTGDIGLFYIVSESSTAAGVRRIEAVTGESAIANLHMQSDQLLEIAQLLSSNCQNLSKRVRYILEREHLLEKELQQLEEQVVAQESANLSNKVIEIKGVKLLIAKLAKVKPKMLRTMVNTLKNQYGSTIIVLATVTEGKVFLTAGISKNVSARIKAGELIDMIVQQVGGKGGGKPDIAQGSGTNTAALSTALASIKDWVTSKL